MMRALGNSARLVYNSGMIDCFISKFTREPDEHRRIERPENPERMPQRAPERKREDFEPEKSPGPDREREAPRVPEREKVPA